MNVAQLNSILMEYRPSMRVNIIVDHEPKHKTTVAELICVLMKGPSRKKIDFFGKSDCIIRERLDEKSLEQYGPELAQWLEIDMR
jgi:hypothetical protein